MSMAFPIPSHLPRHSRSHEVSSKILSKIDEATYASLTASLATSWLVELDETILSTKERLRERIQADRASFDEQLSSAKSIQARLQSLTESVDTLDHAVSHSETGLIPTLIQRLTRHAALSQEYADSALAYEALSHLLQCKTEFLSLDSLVEAGQLPEAAGISESLRLKLENPPSPLGESKVLVDFKQKYRVSNDIIEEQLNDAYARSFVLSPTEIIIRSPVTVQKSETTISLKSILSTLSSSSVSSHLATFQRNLTTHYINRILTQPTSIAVTSPLNTFDMQEHRLTLFPSPPNTEIRSTRLQNLALVLTFLDTYVIACLPDAQKEHLARSLYKPVATEILNHLLIPSLPSKFALLPSFLELVTTAVGFEDEHIETLFRDAATDRIIKTWANGVGGHYERNRRMLVLERARDIVLHAEDDLTTFFVEVEPNRESESELAVLPPVTGTGAVNDEARAFNDEEKADNGDIDVVDETGWGFEDGDDAREPEKPLDKSESPSSAVQEEDITVDEDPATAWGWNDDEEAPISNDENDESTAWDDPWGEDAADSHSPSSHPSSLPATSAPASQKVVQPTTHGKDAQLNGRSSMSNNTSSTRPPKEAYLVSNYARQLARTVEDVLEEGEEFASSKTASSLSSSSSSPHGFLILQSAISVLDIFMAIYPVKYVSALALPERSMRFSNDCIYLSSEVARILNRVQIFPEASLKLVECKETLQVLGDSWFDDTIERHRSIVDETLLECQGFTGTTDQDRYDECEGSIARVLQHVRLLAQRWKGVLTQSKYYVALGLVLDAALSRMLEDILALPDITAEESHKLSELCRIFNSLEGIFFVNLNEPSPVAAYVPSWLKFSYLSELLEASIADISYLFEIGALVDFGVDELVSLVRALFADTPLRAATINKFLGK